MKAEEKAIAYADARLELLRPDIAADNYSRGRKMSLDVFCGSEVESAYEEGYNEALKDIREDAIEGVIIGNAYFREKQIELPMLPVEQYDKIGDFGSKVKLVILNPEP